MWWANSANLRRLIVDIVSGYFATQRLGGFVPSIQNITLADDWLQPPVAMDLSNYSTAPRSLPNGSTFTTPDWKIYY